MEILLVEDEPAHAEIVRRNMKSSRVAHRLTHVSDGLEAMDYLQRQGDYADPARSPRPHIILLDLRLPKIDGLDVLERIKNDPDLRAIPVVVLTTSDVEADRAKAYALHANSYLVKPVDCDAFSELIDVFGFYWLVWNRKPD
ncbi:MAG: response regulator [Lentisphaerota bacterium]